MGKMKNILIDEEKEREIEDMYDYYMNDAISQIGSLKEENFVLKSFIIDKGLYEEYKRHEETMRRINA